MEAPVSFRINPDIDPKTHAYISTGLKSNKFGIPHEQALEAYREAAELPYIRIMGIDAHIGSQLLDVSPFGEASRRLAELIHQIREIGIDIEIIDIGGGLGIPYHEETAPSPEAWAAEIAPVVKETGCRLIIEPGRSLVGNAGVIVTKVLYIKQNNEKTFVIVDTGMNDLTRPVLYSSYHVVLPVKEEVRESRTVEVVGPICESGDFIAKNRALPMPEEGEYLTIMSAGAYGKSMSSNYNSRPRAAEILVDGGHASVIRERETLEDLVARER
jgi:diaminopimelate decarboxylase